MYPKLIFFVTILCVVNSSVITSQEFTSSAEKFESRTTCRPLQCHRQCLKVNIPGGQCVDGICTCPCDAAPTGAKTKIIENSNVISREFPFPAEKLELRTSCTESRCNRLCLKVNLTGPQCENGICTCSCQDAQDLETSTTSTGETEVTEPSTTSTQQPNEPDINT